ncbi:MAG TPA: AAA family ATPase [Armatimonadota bacterium]|nr:AAA family ATPase [Armatimonadota bacterium]
MSAGAYAGATHTTIAVTGKGGTGKTTVAALMVRALVERDLTPVLAVDADPNLNLNAALGIEVAATVGDVREEGLRKIDSLPAGMSKTEFLRYRTAEALVESRGFDLLAMGRPEGPGCYCYANNVLRACVDELQSQYRFIVMDAEAGLEHLSRRTTRDVDLLVLLSDASVRGVETAARALDLIRDLKTSVGRHLLALTRVSTVPPDLEAAVRARGMVVEATIPEDEELRRLDAAGKPLVEVSADSPALAAVVGMLQLGGIIPQ